MLSIIKEPPIVTIVMSRPEVRNAVDRAQAQRLADAFRMFEADPELSVAVLCGDNGTFCSGADLKAVAEGEGNRIETQGDGPLGPTRMQLSKPVISAIEGYAVAGGLELALWSDLRVMAEDATLGFFERRWGVPLIDGGTVRLPRLIGLSRAMDLILTGRPVDAREAKEIGLVHRVVPNGHTRSAAETLAKEIAAFPQICMRGDRLSAYESYGLSIQEAMANEFRHGLEAIKAETVQGATRFAKGAGRHGSFEVSTEEE